MEQDQLSRPDVPIRVIDVAATVESIGGVCFKTPDSWDFHVLSHTWSLEVRAFSKYIGTEIASTLEEAGVYNDAFRDANFSKRKCYEQLKDFLRMLQIDRVEYAWFDALCIDQANESEKCREIGRMGDYYSKSKGCYVLTHGIGKGFSLWKGSEEDFDFEEIRDWQRGLVDSHNAALPRWFERAWTFQEYLLPSKLIFLVGPLHWRLTRFINHYIKFIRSEVGFCKCCCQTGTGTDRVYVSFPHYYKTVAEKNQSHLIYERNQVCKECGSAPLIRKVQKNAGCPLTPEEMVIYFVDREAYTMVLKLYCSLTRYFGCLDEDDIDTGQHYSVNHPPSVNYLERLASAGSSPMSIAWHISCRECTNPEDRILSMLGLLGFGNTIKQVRTGLSLDDQILRLCALDHNLLIQLCAMSIRGYLKPGMSWAPWLFHDPDGFSFDDWDRNQELHGFRSITANRYAKPVRCGPGPILRSDVQVQELNNGGIKLLANIMHTRVIPQDGIYHVIYCNASRGDSGILLRDWGEFAFDVYYTSQHSGFKGSLKLDLTEHCANVEFEMWWIHLGDDASNCKVIMACTGFDIGNLHKFGLFWIPHGIFQTLPFHKRQCYVGGFGRFLDEHVIKH